MHLICFMLRVKDYHWKWSCFRVAMVKVRKWSRMSIKLFFRNNSLELFKTPDYFCFFVVFYDPSPKKKYDGEWSWVSGGPLYQVIRQIIPLTNLSLSWETTSACLHRRNIANLILSYLSYTMKILIQNFLITILKDDYT